MAFLFADGFDLAADTTDLSKRWDTMHSEVTLNTSTAFNEGKSLGRGTNSTTFQKSFLTNEDTIFVYFRRFCSNGITNSLYSYFTLVDGTASNQVSVRINEDGRLTVHTGGPTGTTLGGLATAAPNSHWTSFQIKIVIHDTTGSVEVRRNGDTTPILSLTNVNTRGGSANNYANRILMGFSSSAAAGTMLIDDLFIHSGSGSAPNNWLGDIRIVQQQVISTASTDFTPDVTSSIEGQFTSGSAVTHSSNTLSGSSFVPACAGAIGKMSLSMTAALTGTIAMTIYASDSSGIPQTRLHAGATLVDPPIGILDFTFSPTVAVSAGSTYWAMLQSTASVILASANSGTRALISLAAAAGFPATLPPFSLPSGQPFYVSVEITNGSADNLSVNNADTNTISSITTGHKDLYTLSTLPADVTTVAGVIPYCIARRSEAGGRTLAVKAANGTTEVSVVTTNPPVSFYVIEGFLETDPNTGTTWTPSGANTLKVGPEIVS